MVCSRSALALCGAKLVTRVDDSAAPAALLASPVPAGDGAGVPGTIAKGPAWQASSPQCLISSPWPDHIQGYAIFIPLHESWSA